MKKLLGIVVLGLLWGTSVLAESKIIYLECKSDYSTNLKTGETGPTAGKFTFRINKEAEKKAGSGTTVGLTATRSDGIVRLFFGSSSDDNYSFQGFDGEKIPNTLFIETLDINRINGQLTNNVQIFKNTNEKKKENEKPDAELIHYSNCNVSKAKF